MNRLTIVLLIMLIMTSSGCRGSLFGSNQSQEEINRTIEIDINATTYLNRSSSGVSRPVKICVIELNREDWSPSELNTGQICSAVKADKGVLDVTAFMLIPRGHHLYKREVPRKQIRWFVIAAEFQNQGKNNYLQIKAEARRDHYSMILVGGDRLLRLTRIKPEDGEEE